MLVLLFFGLKFNKSPHECLLGILPHLLQDLLVVDGLEDRLKIRVHLESLVRR